MPPLSFGGSPPISDSSDGSPVRVCSEAMHKPEISDASWFHDVYCCIFYSAKCRSDTKCTRLTKPAKRDVGGFCPKGIVSH